jgi:hypothetical protein
MAGIAVAMPASARPGRIWGKTATTGGPVYQRWRYGNGLVGQLMRGDGPGSVQSLAGHRKNGPH